ncbi:MAG: hypothetical protein V7644_2349 [Actinomycetota bacterium]|jgi:hypothetical protein
MRRLAPLLLLLAPVAGAWTWPVHGPVLQTFSFDRAHPYAAGQRRGIDVGAASGTPVRAPAAGTVSFAGTVPTSGKVVTIETAGGLAVTLTHLGTIAVPQDARVAEGAAVGTVGPSGTPDLDVPYVHMGVREASDPEGYLDPLGFLPPPSGQEPAATPAPTQAAAQEAPATSAAPPAQAAAAAAASAAGQQAEPESPPADASPGVSITSVPKRAAQGAPAPRAERAAQLAARPLARLHRAPHRAAPSLRSTARSAAATAAAARPKPALPPLHRVGRPFARATPALQAPRPRRTLPGAGDPASAPAPHRPLPLLLFALLAVALAGAAAAAVWAARIIRGPFPRLERVQADVVSAEDPGSRGLAVCERTAAPGPRGRPWSPVRHLRPLPPAQGQRRPHGQRDRRARYAGHGLGRSRRRVSA